MMPTSATAATQRNLRISSTFWAKYTNSRAANQRAQPRPDQRPRGDCGVPVASEMLAHLPTGYQPLFGGCAVRNSRHIAAPLPVPREPLPVSALVACNCAVGAGVPRFNMLIEQRNHPGSDGFLGFADGFLDVVLEFAADQ